MSWHDQHVRQCQQSTHVFPRVRREGIIIDQVVDRFIPLKLKKGADVIGGTRENLNRDSTRKSLRGRVVQKESDIHQTEKPEGCGRSGAIKDSVGDRLDGLIPALRRVLLLLVGFTLPIRDAEGMKDVLNLLTDFDLSTVGNELSRSTMASNVILQGIDKLLVSLHVATVNCWRSIQVNSIGGNGLVAAMDVEGRIGRFEAVLKIRTHGHARILISASESFLDRIEG
jgi:hypothetical protein